MPEVPLCEAGADLSSNPGLAPPGGLGTPQVESALTLRAQAERVTQRLALLAWTFLGRTRIMSGSRGTGQKVLPQQSAVVAEEV